jgi:putative transcriptional regulator
MMDPNFKRSVIFLTEYSEMGAMGLVLNHPGGHLLGDLIPGLPGSKFPVYNGGPVGNDILQLIHRCPDKIIGGVEVWDGVFWGGDFEMIKQLILNDQLTNDEIKFFTGYSGWTSGQLESELKENSWIVTDKFKREMLFCDDEQNLWREVVISLGRRFAHIANFPQDPSLN